MINEDNCCIQKKQVYIVHFFSSGWNTLPQLERCSGMVIVLWIDQIGLYCIKQEECDNLIFSCREGEV